MERTERSSKKRTAAILGLIVALAVLLGAFSCGTRNEKAAREVDEELVVPVQDVEEQFRPAGQSGSRSGHGWSQPSHPSGQNPQQDQTPDQPEDQGDGDQPNPVDPEDPKVNPDIPQGPQDFAPQQPTPTPTPKGPQDIKF